MHPAPSVIVFTTFSGLGFGLLIFLGLGYPAVTGWMAFIFFAIAYAMAVGGLTASTFHLGHPERAVKAFTQWRTSWLSREAWTSVAALVVMGLYGAGLVFLDTRWAPLGWLGAALSLLTVYTTSMIYAQLRTVPRWHSALTPVMFLSLRLAESGTDLATATGLGSIGRVRSFEPPHTGTNYLLREFVHVVGRRHSQKLRIISFALMVVVPIGLLALPFNHFVALLAVLSHITGVLVSRWLFFAEAEHVVGLYYGKR
jgi:DMSO reductase anchor subunit